MVFVVLTIKITTVYHRNHKKILSYPIETQCATTKTTETTQNFHFAARKTLRVTEGNMGFSMKTDETPSEAASFSPKTIIFAARKEKTTMTKKENAQPTIDDLFEYMLKKLGVSKKDVYEASMRRWIMSNLDSLTAAERSKFANLMSK